MKRLAGCAALLLILLVAAGCGSKSSTQAQKHGDPRAACGQGFLDLAQDRFAPALQAFQGALQTSPGYAPALAGYAAWSAFHADPAKARRLLKQAYGNATRGEEQAFAGLAELMVLRGLADPNGVRLGQAILAHHKFEPELEPLLYYELGRLYWFHCKFGPAQEAFAFSAAGEWDLQKRALGQAKLAAFMASADPQSGVGCQLVKHPRLKRGDLAALLVHELNLPAFLKVQGAAPAPPDCTGHSRLAEIRAVMALNLKSLGVGAGGNFQPEKAVSRAELAMLLQEVLIRLGGDQKLATSYLSAENPFVDLSPLDYAFNAALLAVDRGLMKPIDPKHFGPGHQASGYDAVAALGRLRR